jgi:argininosuccinate synthase
LIWLASQALIFPGASASRSDSLFDSRIATFDDDGGAYNQADAAGFIRLNALRLRIGAKRRRGRK